MIQNFHELVSRIKSQIPIHELISEFISIKKAGSGYVAVCPFHDDHQPSLHINPKKGIFKCFACGTGGDLFSFYSLINKKKWNESVIDLATKYGFQIEYGAESKTEVQVKNQLYELNKVVLEFYKSNLFSAGGEEALDYLKKTRTISSEFVEKYELGKANNSWDSLFNYLTKQKGYPLELVLASGLILTREDQRGYYDRFRNRIIFPISNENNFIVGFGGRALSSDDVKYLNSPETLIFSKGYILYGLNHAKDEIKKLDHVIVTEGYFDVITAHQYGLTNTVATLGTALTHNHLRLLAKHTESKKIYLCLDSDNAGKKAVESIFRLSQELNRFTNIDLRVTCDLPAKDLDESLKAENEASIKSRIENGKKITDFIFDRLIKNYIDASNETIKREVMDNIIDVISSVNDPLEQKDSIKYVSHKLNLEEELINLKIRDKLKLTRQKKLKFQKDNVKKDDDFFKMHSLERFKHAELALLSLYISSFPYQENIKLELSNINLLDEKHSLIKEFVDNINQSGITPMEVIDQLILSFNEYKHMMSVISDLALRIETEEENRVKNKEKIISESKEWINWWITNKQKMKNLTKLLKECKDSNEETKILSEMMSVIKKV